MLLGMLFHALFALAPRFEHQKVNLSYSSNDYATTSMLTLAILLVAHACVFDYSLMLFEPSIIALALASAATAVMATAIVGGYPRRGHSAPSPILTRPGRKNRPASD